MSEKSGTDLPQHLPELIVCRNEHHARYVRRQVGDQPNIHVASALGGAMAFRASAFAKVTVCEGVDLDRDVDGEGCLEALLRSRQVTWGDRAVFVVL